MTPASAAASNAAARAAGWFGDSYANGVTNYVRDIISERNTNQERRKVFLDLIRKNGPMTTIQIAKATNLHKATVHSMLIRMIKSGHLKHSKKVIAGRINAIWEAA